MALKELRNASRSWVAGVFVGLLVISFAVWGVADIFGQQTVRGVARVGKTWITASEFQQRYRSEAESFRQQTGQSLTPEQARTFGLTDRVLQFLIDIAAVEEMGRRIGLAAHDESVKADILGTPAFQGLDGQFDTPTYERALREVGYTPVTYAESLRGDIIRQQMVRAVMEGSHMPRGLVETLIAHNAERRAVSYVRVTPAMAGDPPAPTDEALQAYVEENQDQFSTPEYRTFVAIVLRPDDLIDEVALTEEELKQQYDFELSKFSVPERRKVRTMAFSSEAEARQAIERIEAGESFESVGLERGLTDAELAVSDKTRSEIVDGAVAEAAFAPGATGLIGPVDGDLAWAIAEVGDVTPGFTKPFADVKEEIRVELARSRSQDLLYEIINSIEDSRAEGQTLEEIAQRLNLRLVKGQKVDAQGDAADGSKPLADIEEDAQAVLDAVFETEEGLENDFRTGAQGGQFVVRLDSVDPPQVKDLAAVRAEASAAFVAGEKRKLTQQRAQDVLAQAQSAGGLLAAAQTLSTAVQSLDEPINRQVQSEILSRTLVADLFSIKSGELTVGSVPDSEDWIIAAVTEIIAPKTAEVAAGVTQVAPQLDQALSNNLAAQFVAGLRQDLGVRIEQSAVEQAATGSQF